MKKRNVLVAWTLILFLTVVVLELVYTPYDYAGYQIVKRGQGAICGYKQ